jgi:hypothetical protein
MVEDLGEPRSLLAGEKPRAVQVSRMQTALLAGLGCLLVSLATIPIFMADSFPYTGSLMAFDPSMAGDPHNLIWDFGHLIWRWSALALFNLARPIWMWFAEGEDRLAHFLPLLVMSWTAGCVALYLLLRLVQRFTASWLVILGSAAAYLTVFSILNNLQSGTPYLPGLMCVTAATLHLERAKDRWRDAVFAGFLLALASLYWVPYIFVMPAVLLTPVLLSESSSNPWRLILRSAVCAALIAIAVFAVPVVYLRMFSLHQIAGWMMESSHRWVQNRRLLRFFFGFPRSFLYMGNDGILFKRYLFHDPYAPVSLGQLFRASMVKVGVAFSYFGLLTLALARTPGRRAFLWMACAVGPLVAFAILLFEPGSPERFLPLVPFLIVAAVIAGNRLGWMRRVNGAFVLLLAAINIPAHWRPSVNAEVDKAEARVHELRRRLKPASREMMLNFQDEVYADRQGYPFHPYNRNSVLHTVSAVELVNERTPFWRQHFARLTRETWTNHGDVWLSARLLAGRPDPSWYWTESDDPRVAWADIPRFFRSFELGEAVGGGDGFVLLPKTAGNERQIESLLSALREGDGGTAAYDKRD